MIRESVAEQLGASVQTSSYRALQADGQSFLIVTGKTSITFNCGKHAFILEALIVSNLECDVLAGVPFMIHNDMSVCPSKRLVLVGDEIVFEYHHQSKSSSAHSINYVTAHILRVSSGTTIWPGEFIEVNIPPGLPGNTEMTLEPQCDTNKLSCDCPPLSIVSSSDGKIHIPNLTTGPIVLKKDDHFGQLSEVFVPETVFPQQSMSSLYQEPQGRLITQLTLVLILTISYQMIFVVNLNCSM